MSPPRACLIPKRSSGRAPWLCGMIEGAAALEELDLMGQQRLTAATRRLVECLLFPKWFQTPATLGHAKLFFADFKPAIADDLALGDVLKFSDAPVREYLS